MSLKGTAFVEFFDNLIEKNNIELPEDVAQYYKGIKTSVDKEKSKPLITEVGATILEFMQEHPEQSLKAKDIAYGLSVPTRKINGAMQKLVKDGWLDKFGADPVYYSITDNGKNFDMKSYKENMNNA